MEMNEERKGFETLLPQNRVENFNPNDVLTLVEDVDENGQPAEFLYMEFAASSRWFYTVFPNGRMDYDRTVFKPRRIRHIFCCAAKRERKADQWVCKSFMPCRNDCQWQRC